MQLFLQKVLYFFSKVCYYNTKYIIFSYNGGKYHGFIFKIF